MECQLPVWVFCVHQPSIYVLVVKAEIIIGALCIPLILTMLAMFVWTHNQTCHSMCVLLAMIILWLGY